MDDLTEYSQNATKPKSHRGLKIASGSLGAAVLLIGGIWGGTAYASYSSEQARISAQSAVPAAPAGEATTSNSQTALAQSDAAGAQVVLDEQAKEVAAALAAKKAAAAKAAALRAAEVADAGPVHCSAGSTADEVDANGNATLCFPDICFHLSLPDPSHPECEAAFKP